MGSSAGIKTGADYTTTPLLPGIRRMTDLAAQNAVDKALATLKDGEHGAVVMYATGEEVRAGVFGRVGKHWTYCGTLSRQWSDGKLGAEAEVRFTF